RRTRTASRRRPSRSTSARRRRRTPSSALALGRALVQPALALEPEKARLLLRHAVGELRGGVPVADRRITLLPERVVGQIVARQVVVDVLVVPVDDRMDL